MRFVQSDIMTRKTRQAFKGQSGHYVCIALDVAGGADMPVSLYCTCYHELNNGVNKRNQWQRKKMTVEETGCRKSGYFCCHTKPAWSMKIR